ncbi:MAG: tandem-95 repeat protein, partial [Verrucomicrobia bacterium]
MNPFHRFSMSANLAACGPCRWPVVFLSALIALAGPPTLSAATVSGTITATQGPVAGATVRLTRGTIAGVGQIPTDAPAAFTKTGLTKVNFPTTTGNSFSSVWPGGPADLVGARFTTLFGSGAGGHYTFWTESDDGSALYVDGNLVVNNDGLHGMATASGSIDVSSGNHSVEVRFFEQNGGAGINVFWAYDGFVIGLGSFGSQLMTSGTTATYSAVGTWGAEFWTIPSDTLSTVTGADGKYSFTVASLKPPFTVTPSLPAATFAPVSANAASNFALKDSPPQISNIADQTTPEDTAITVPFSVSDYQTAPASLGVAVASSNPGLVPPGNVTIAALGGGSRSAAIVPVPNANGAATLTFTVTDGDGKTASDTFVVNVTSANDLPVARADTSRPANQTILVKNFGLVAPTNEVTIEFWQLTTAQVSQSTFMMLPDIAGNRANAHLPWITGEIFWDWGNILSGPGRLSYTPPESPVGQWNHFAFVASQSGNYMRIYRNGVQEAGKSGMSPFVRGARDLVLNPVGRLADFRIWNVARTASQIAENLGAPVPPATAGLVLNYRFEASAGSDVRDWAAFAVNPAQEGSQAGLVTTGPLYWDNTEALLASKLGIQVAEDSPKLIHLPGFDVEQASPVYSAVSATAGRLVQVDGGDFLYTPPPGASLPFGADAITYTVGDGTDAATGSLKLQVNAFNNPPVVGPGSSVALDGNSQYLDVPNGVWFGDTFTVEGWVLLRNYANWARFFDFGNGPASDNVLGGLTAGSTGLPALHVYRGGSSQSIQSTQQIPTGVWTHVAFTRDGDGIGHIFIDGVETASGPIHAPDNVVRKKTYIGRSNWDGDALANVRFGEVRIWNVARTARQLTDGRHASLPDETAGLLAAYHLNENSGGIAHDAATGDGAQDAILVGNPAWVPLDGPAKSLAFDGTSQYAQTLDSPPISITGPITVEAWIQPRTIGTYQGIVGKYDGDNGGYALRLDPQGKISFLTLDPAYKFSSVGGQTTIPVNEWTHVAGQWDGTLLRVYVNGILDGYALSGRNPKDGATPLIVGAIPENSNSYRFQGRIGDLRIWNVARSAAEISAGRDGVGSKTAGLVLNYLFDEGSGTTLLDAAAGDGTQNGTLLGTVAWNDTDPNLARRQTVNYTEDVPLDLVLPAFDAEAASLIYSDVNSSTGKVSRISGKLFRFLPPANYNGPATITYTVGDGTTKRGATVYLQGIPVEDGPTLGAIPTQTIGEGTPTSTLPISVTDGDPELVQGLSITATSSDPTLVRDPGVVYTSPEENAQLTYKPRPGRSGTAVITVVVTDLASGLALTNKFDLVVTPVDDPVNVGPATALQFNAGNFVRVAGFGNVTPVDEITIEYWQYANTAAVQSMFAMNPDDPANRISATAPGANNQVTWDFGNASAGGRLSYTPPVSVVGSWQHFAFVASRAGNFMKIYRNGIEEATKPGMSSFVSTGAALELGRFVGQLAEFRVWKTVRSAEEIRSAMHSSLPNETPNLVAYYRFNQKPTTVLLDFASLPGQSGSQDGELVADSLDVDPLWMTPTGTPSWQVSDPALLALQIVRVPDGTTTNLFLPASDAENGLNLNWKNVNASTGSVVQVQGGLWAYTAPKDHDGPATINYDVEDAAGHVTTGSLNLRVVIALNDPPTIAAIPNVAAEEDSARIEIPFTVGDDRPPSALTITPVLLVNAELIQSIAVLPGGAFRTLEVVPKPGEIGTVHIRLLVQDSGGKQVQTEFDLRIEPRPAFSVFDLGVIPGKSASFGTAINDRGAVAGYMAETADLESNPVGFFFNGIENGGVVEANPPVQVGPSPLSSPFRAYAVNNSYTLAGAGRSGGNTNAWSKGIEEAVIDLGRLIPGTIAEARALNDAGELVGFATLAGGQRRAFRASKGDGAIANLGVAPPPFDSQSEAFALNRSNHIVGSIYAADGRRRAMIFRDAAMRPLFDVPDDTNSVAYGVNQFDQVVGSTTSFAVGDTALGFDGVDARVTVTNLLTNPSPGTPLVAGNAAHTVEAWIQVHSLPSVRSWPVLLGNPADGSQSWTIVPDNGGTLNLGFVGSGSIPVPVTLNAWMHVATAYDPPSSKLVVYINGKPVGTNAVAGVDLQGIPLRLAAAQNGEQFFSGEMDEVRVWRTTRTAAEVADNYTRRLSGTETGLVAYLPFDEGSGTARTTSLALGNLVGGLGGDPEWTVRGGLPSPNLTVSDPVLQFDGVSSQAAMPPLPLANASFTIEFRARRAELGTRDVVVSQGTSGDNLGLSVGFNAADAFVFTFGSGDLATPSAYVDTDWHHWACTFNVANGVRRIYRDGTIVAQDHVDAAFQGTGPVLIGTAPFVPGSWFKGLIDDVRFWNVVRSGEDIAANADTRVAGNTPGLISAFTFDEGGGNTAVNRVPTAAGATLQGAIGWAGRDTGTRRAFLYDTDSGRLASLGTVPGGGSSEAQAINDFGQIVGTAVKSAGTHAFFYSAGRLNDLNDLLPEADQLDQWNLESARGINRSGAIVGTGTHRGLKRAFLALPATIIGRPVIRPQGAVDRMPQISILKKHLPDDSELNSFYWSPAEKKLYAIRPVTAKLQWYTSFDDTVGSGKDLAVNTDRVVSVTVNVWPKQPIIHIAGAPANLQPVFTAATYTFQRLIYVTNLASVEPSSKAFTSPTPGYTVLHYLKTDGLASDPTTQRPYFDVVRTVAWNDSHAGLSEANWRIGDEVTEAGHTEYDQRNGFVLFPNAAYDAVGSDRAYDRGTRLGPILPVNTEKPGGNQLANPDPLVVVWYRTNRIGVAWSTVPVQYTLDWPKDDAVDRIVIASLLGSGMLENADYPAKTIYNQPDIAQPGFNPNEEHAYMPVDTLYAIRNDLNAIRNYSQPYALLKYRDPSTSRWRMKVYKVVAEQAPYFFTYAGTVGKEIQPPLPLSLMPLCEASYQQPPDSRVGWEDYKGKVYARMAGPDGTHTNLMVRWFYPMQPGFFHPDDKVSVGDCLAWLDRRPAGQLQVPNETTGRTGTPIDVTYDIRWDDHPVLQIGETLLHSKHGLPDVFAMANAKVIFDSLSPDSPAGVQTLTRFYDPLSARTLKTGVIIPGSIKRQNINGKDYFADLPWMLKLRMTYDPVNNWLSFGGHLDENFGVGEPLLLPNVLSERERDRLKKLADGDGGWASLMDRLYDLTRNPNAVDLDPRDGRADKALRVGLTTNDRGQVVSETLGDGPKALTAGIGGLPAAKPKPGNALAFDGASGLVTIGKNGGQDLDLAGTPFTLEFWAKVTNPSIEQYVLGQPGGDADFGRLRVGFRDGGKFAFDLGTTPASPSIFNSSSAYTDTGWHHWACTFDPESKIQAIYRDGVQTDSRTNVVLTYAGLGTVEIGRFGNKYFAGQLDEIRVWKTARSGAEIRSQMNKRLLGAQTPPPAGPGSELKLEILYRCDEIPRGGGKSVGPLANDSLATRGGYAGTVLGGVRSVVSTAPTGIPPRYLTIAENDDEALAGLPVALHVIRVDDGPFLGDLKVLPGDNVFDERLTLRHSSDFGGDPGPLTFQWYYKPIGADFDPTDLPVVTDPTAEFPGDMRGWTPYRNYLPLDGRGVNYVTTGEGGESGLITISDNAFICRYRGYAVNLESTAAWSDWVGDPSGTADQPRAALAEGWVKRVIRGLNPFDAGTTDFHASPVNTFASMLIQLGQRYEGPIAFNPGADAINKIGLIEAYTTVQQRAQGLSIDGVPQVDFNPANNALLLVATKLSDFYMVLGNEAYADASDPTIGFGTASTEYGSLASSIFSFQNQLDSLLDEELALLRGRDDSAAGVGARPVYNRLFWNFTLGEGEVAYKQNYNISDQDSNGLINDKDARILYPQGHGDAWGHYLMAVEQHYALLRHPYFTWIPRSELVSVGGAAIKVDFLDERKFARAASAKAKAGAE